MLGLVVDLIVDLNLVVGLDSCHVVSIRLTYFLFISFPYTHPSFPSSLSHTAIGAPLPLGLADEVLQQVDEVLLIMVTIHEPARDECYVSTARVVTAAHLTRGGRGRREGGRVSKKSKTACEYDGGTRKREGRREGGKETSTYQAAEAFLLPF